MNRPFFIWSIARTARSAFAELPGPARAICFTMILLVPLVSACSRFIAPESKVAEILRAKLPNGLRVVVIRNPIAAVVTTVVNYHVGSNEAPAGFPGTAHAQEHMMFRGSPGLTAAQLADINAALGGSFNADTQQTVTQYFFTVPSEYLDVALHLEAIRMRGVLDTEKLWRQERGAIEQEVARDLSSPEYVFYTKLLAAMFKGTSYAHDALGTKASFDATTGAMLKQFYDTWYVPNNATIVITGNVNPKTTLGRVKQYFGQIPAKPLPPRSYVNLSPVPPQTVELASDLPYNMVLRAFRMPGYNSPDYAASQILADVLDSRRGSLYELTAQGKTLEAGFQLNTLPESGLGFVVAAFDEKTNPREIVDALQAVLARYKEDGFSADLVEAAKRREIAQAEFQKNSVFGLAMAWSRALVVEGRQSPQEDIDAIAQVTVADVNRVARRYLDTDHAITAILKPQISNKPITAKGFGGTESFALPQSRDVTLPDWAENALKQLTIPKPRPDVVERQLANGITLIVVPTTISRTVSLYGHVKNNPALQVPRGKEGVDDVLSGLFDYGTRTLDRRAFEKALDDIAADVSVGTDFSLEVLAEHFDRGTRLLADNLLHPALPANAFEIVRRQTAAVAAGDLHSPDKLSHRVLVKALYPKNDPMVRWTTPQSAASLTLDDVKAYYARVMRPDETVIAVIGDIQPDEAQKVIETYFGGWQARGPKPDLMLPTVPSNPPETIRVPNKSRVQDQVVLAETLGLTRSDPDYYALALGNHVLGGGFYATRLYRDLREETGLVYTVAVALDAGKRRSAYVVEFACDPANTEKAGTIVKRNIETMQNDPVSPEELHLAKAMLLRDIPLGEESIGSIAQGLIDRRVMNLPLDEPARAARRYMALTAEQVRAAFAKWLRPGDWVQVTEGPAP